MGEIEAIKAYRRRFYDDQAATYDADTSPSGEYREEIEGFERAASILQGDVALESPPARATILSRRPRGAQYATV